MRGGEVLHEATLGLTAEGRPRHSTALLAEVERAAAASGGWQQVGRIAVGRGPGSFVGIRIGLATARGLASSADVSVKGICTLDALGRGMAEQGEGDNLAVLDARRGEVFAALYSSVGERLWEPLVAAPEALVARLSELPVSPRTAGSGAVRFRQELVDRGVDIPDDADPVHRVSARHICALAGSAGQAGADSLEPIYLRPPDAQRWRERDDPKRAK